MECAWGLRRMTCRPSIVQMGAARVGASQSMDGGDLESVGGQNCG